MDSYIIQVQPQDELTVIIDKVIHTQASRVYLLVPEGSRISQHVLNFRLLKREADALHKEVVVVSSSARVQSLALTASLQVHQETNELRMGAVQGSQKVISSPPKLADIVTLSPQEKSPPKVTRRPRPSKTDITPQERKIISFWTRQPSFSLNAKNSLIALPRFAHRLVSYTSLSTFHWNTSKVFKIALLGMVAAAFSVAALSFYFVLPRAKIYIKPVIEDVESEISIQGNINISQVDLVKRILPAQIFERSLKDSRVVTSSGEKDIKAKAEGVIRIYNAYSSVPQTLVATTRFVSESGKLFRTKETIVVRGAEVEEGKIVPSFTEVEVVASEPGEEYNIGPSTFSVPGFKGTDKYLGFYGKSVSDMTGGRIGRVKIVMEADYIKTKEELERSLKARAEEDLTLALPEGFFIMPGASQLRDVQIASTGEPGDIISEFTMSGSISSRAFAVRRSDVDHLIEQDFNEKFPDKKRIPRKDGMAFTIRKLDFEKGALEFHARLSQQVAAIVKETLLRQEVRGKREQEVRAFLSSHPAIKEARVTFWPFWVTKIPDDISKVEIVIE